MSIYTLKWHARATNDLIKITLFIGKDSQTRAIEFKNKLIDKITILTIHPEFGKLGRIPNIRELVVHRNYIVFYRINTALEQIEVINIKHAAQQT